MKSIALIGALALTGSAFAAFTGVSYTEEDATVYGGAAGDTVFTWYANFDNPLDQLNGIGSGASQALTFWTDDEAGIRPMGVAGLGYYIQFVAQDYESWATIGYYNGTTVSGDDENGFSQATGNFTGGYGTPEAPGWVMSNGGWQRAGGAQGTAVMFGRIVVADGSYWGLEFQLDGNTFDGDGVVQEFLSLTNVIPAPGALALLGLAGLARRRRR